MGKIFSLSPLKSLRHKLHLLVTFGVIAVLAIAGLTYSSLQKASAYADDEFVTRWTDLPAGELKLKLHGSDNRFIIYWDDNDPNGSTAYNVSEVSHNYTTAGTRNIRIKVQKTGDWKFNGWSLNNNNRPDYLTHVLSWGNIAFTNMSYMFFSGTRLNSLPSDAPNTSQVTDMSYMFFGARAFNQPVNFDTKNVTSMRGMFTNAATFNQPVNFDTKNVTDMSYMFNGTNAFNQPVNFDTKNVTNMSYMFANAKSFNQDLSGFDFSKITSSSALYNFVSSSKLSITNYDKLLKKWHDQFRDQSITHKPGSNALKYCTAAAEHDFLKNTKNWILNDRKECPPAFTTRWTDLPAGELTLNLHGNDNTFKIDWGDGTVETKTNVAEISHNYTSAGTREIKIYASEAGQKFNGWILAYKAQYLTHVLSWGDVVFTNMSQMFQGATKLNSLPSSAPNTSKVTNMSQMFNGATAFNQPVNFDTKNVTNMGEMFFGATTFNQPVNFDTKNVTNMYGMFANATAFNYPVNFDTKNVTNMVNMFANATAFNQPINFNTSKVINARFMFHRTTAFDQDLSGFDFSKIVNQNNLENFISGSKLSVTNYDKLLKKWHDQFKNQSVVHQPQSTGLKYCKAATEHDYLKNTKNWKFRDSKDCSSFNLAPTDITLSNAQINENNAPNFELADITITNDPNDIPDDTNTPSLTCETAGPDDSNFQIAGNKLIFKPSANFEAKNQYKLCIRATDAGGKIKDKNFTIDVKDINEKPALENQTFNIAENTTNGTEVGQVVASDPDNGQSLTYSIVSGNDLDIFEITTDGKIKVKDNTNLDHEQHQSITIKVKATDNGTPALHSDADITINITDVNEKPTIKNQTFSVAENSANGTEIGQIAATDPEHQNLDYKITDGNDLGIFEIGANGKIKVKDNTNLDFEKHQSVTLRVKVTDNGSPALHAEADITINITDVNEKPVVKNQTFSVAENTANGTEVGQVAATDPDAGQILSYAIVNGNDLNIFELTTDGKLKVKDSTNLDYEKHQSITIKVRATDNGTPALHSDADITVNITDINEAPAWTSTDQLTVNEDTTTEHALAATDPENSSLTYSAEETLPSWIKLTNNKLTLKPTQSEVGNHEIKLKVSDGTNETKQTLKITVKNVNDAPIITSNALKSATEDQLYSYTLTATDEDGDLLTYSAIKKPNWLNFDSTTQTLSGTPGNSEADKDYEITLTVSDGTATTTQTFTLHVNKINHAPSITDQNFTIAENTANGTEVGQIITTDPDNNQTLNYQILSGNDLNIFEITNDGKLKIKDNTNLDYEKHQSVTLRVKVTDNDTPALSAEADITINITDVDDEAPTVTVNKDPITLTVGDTLTIPTATCHDNQSNCTLTTENNVDTTTAGSYHITYTAIDEAGNKTIVTVPVTVKAKTPPTPPTPSNPSGSNQNQNSNQNHTTKPSSSNNASNNPSFSLSGALSFNPNLNRRSNYRYFNNQFTNQIGQNNQTDQNHDADTTSSTHGKNKSKNKTAIFSLKGKATIKLKQGQKYVEPGVKCNDSSSCTVSITGKVNKDLPGTYIITYKGSANGKTKTLTRKVIVKSADQTKDSKDSNIFNWWWLLIPTTVVLYGNYKYRRYKQQKSS